MTGCIGCLIVYKHVEQVRLIFCPLDTGNESFEEWLCNFQLVLEADGDRRMGLMAVLWQRIRRISAA